MNFKYTSCIDPWGKVSEPSGPSLEEWVDLLLLSPTDWLKPDDCMMVSSPYILGTCRKIPDPLFVMLSTLSLLPEGFDEMLWNIKYSEPYIANWMHKQQVTRRFCRDVLGKEAASALPGQRTDVRADNQLDKALIHFFNGVLTRPSGVDLKLVKAESNLWQAVFKMLTWMYGITWLWEHPVILFGEIIKERSLVLFGNGPLSKGTTISEKRKRWQSENRRIKLLDETQPRNPFDPTLSPTTYLVIKTALDLEQRDEGGSFRKDFFVPVVDARMKLTQMLLKPIITVYHFDRDKGAKKVLRPKV